MSKSRVGRAMMVILAGGVLLQAGGCATTLGPIALSLFESLLISSLTGGLLGGL